MAKKIMILGASILQLPAIVMAKDMGLEVIVVDMNPNAIGMKEDGVIKEIISTTDTLRILEVAKKHNIDGIMTLATDMPVRSLATVATELNLIGLDTETAINATNKARMRKVLSMNNVPIPKFFEIRNEIQYLDMIRNFDRPFIVKPVESSGSRGVIKVNEIGNKDKVKNAYHYSREYASTGVLIVEEFMSGPEVSVETISIDGKCTVIQITDKVTTGEPYFVEIAHSQPTMLRKDIVSAIEEVAISAVNAIGIKNGPSHVEIIVTDEGPKIVELGARLGGDNIATHLTLYSTGINLVKCCIAISLGEEPDLAPTINKGSAIRYFKQKQGKITNISGLEDARNICGIKQVSVVHGVGDNIYEIMNSSSRMGFVIAQADCPKLALFKCSEALDKIRVEIE